MLDSQLVGTHLVRTLIGVGAGLRYVEAEGHGALPRIVDEGVGVLDENGRRGADRCGGNRRLEETSTGQGPELFDLVRHVLYPSIGVIFLWNCRNGVP